MRHIRAALAALYDATDGLNWNRNDGWLTDAPLWEWQGVHIGPIGRVVGLGLHENGLTGPIPPELGSLARLRSLFLSRNGLTGSIPPKLGGLARLEGLGRTRVEYVAAPDRNRR